MGILSVAEILKTIPEPKMQSIDLKKLKRDPKIQIRFEPSQNTFGFSTQFGDTDIQNLKLNVLSVGRIHTPLHVWKVSKDEHIILRGNTRHLVADMLYNDDNTPAGVKENMKKLDCWVYEGLNKEQALALVDDQSDTNPYKKVDAVNMFWKLDAQGIPWNEIGRSHARLYAKYQGNDIKLREFLDCKTVGEQDLVIKSWMHGGLEQTILAARRLGERVQKAFLLTIAAEDGLIKEGMEKAEFNPKTRQAFPGQGTKKSRIAILQGLRKEDPTGWEKPGSAFNQAIQQFIDEDNNVVERAVIERPTVAGLIKLRDGCQSTAMKVAYDNAAGNKREESMEIDANAARVERVFKGLNEVLPSIKHPDVREAIAFILKSNNEGELLLQLKKFM